MENYNRLKKLEEEMQELQDSRTKDKDGNPVQDPVAAKVERFKEKNKAISELEKLRREYEEEQCKSGHGIHLSNRIRITRQMQDLERKLKDLEG